MAASQSWEDDPIIVRKPFDECDYCESGYSGVIMIRCPAPARDPWEKKEKKEEDQNLKLNWKVMACHDTSGGQSCSAGKPCDVRHRIDLTLCWMLRKGSLVFAKKKKKSKQASKRGCVCEQGCTGTFHRGSIVRSLDWGQYDRKNCYIFAIVCVCAIVDMSCARNL